MVFCQNCGEKLDDKAKFCTRCGKPVVWNDMSKRQQEFGGKIIKCPNCGEILPAFITRCKACGYELRGANAPTAVKEFELELKQIENERRDENVEGKGKAFTRSLKAKTANSIDLKLASRISNFAVPNTKEDIIEFMILAASNIDPTAYGKGKYGYGRAEREGRLLVSNAWNSKYNQVYQKAKMMFPEDPRLVEIEKLYKSKQKQIKGTKPKTLKIIVGFFGFYSIFILLIFMYVGAYERKSDKLNDQLNQTVVEIQSDIANGDYDVALIKANTLRFDPSLSSSRTEAWDEQREALIKLINEPANKKSRLN